MESLLQKRGPMRAAQVADRLRSRFGTSPEAARKRISRARPPIRRFPVQLLPKGESFLYLQDQRRSGPFWGPFQEALRATNSIYGYAIDALSARGGAIQVDEFPVVSGAPKAMKRQVSSSRLLETLVIAGVFKETNDPGLGACIEIIQEELGFPDFDDVRARRIAEGVVLDALREWVRKLGIGSYNAVAVRGDDSLRLVGPFKWDLTAPCYLLPFMRPGAKPGFVVADVFVGSFLNKYQIRYFVRKAQMVKAAIPAQVLPMLVADGYSKAAIQEGKGAGVLMATPTNLFGQRVGEALQDLVHTLRNAAATAATDPKALVDLVESLLEIEGVAGNLRGILFELIAAHLARLDANSIDLGIAARDPATGRTADIDVLKVRSRGTCTCIECKGKGPGGIVTLQEIEDWLRRIPTFRAHLRQEQRFRESELSFEFWTTGEFAADALEKLKEEKRQRKRSPIDWYDGRAVSKMAGRAKEKAIRVALDNHFLRHPLT